MKCNHQRMRVAALALFVCLAVAPVTVAAPSRDRDYNFSERIVRVLKKVTKLFGSVVVFEDFPNPPRP